MYRFLALMPNPDVSGQANDFWNNLRNSQYFYPAIASLIITVVLVWITRQLPAKLKGIIIGLAIAFFFGSAILTVAQAMAGAVGK